MQEIGQIFIAILHFKTPNNVWAVDIQRPSKGFFVVFVIIMHTKLMTIERLMVFNNQKALSLGYGS